MSEAFGRIELVAAESTACSSVRLETRIQVRRNLMVSFAPPKTITGTVERDAEAPRIAASGNDVYIVWHERPIPAPPPPAPDNTPDHEVWLSRSTNKGASFGQRVNISNTPGRSDGEALAVRGDNVYVAWIDIDPASMAASVKFRRSANKGQNFGSTKTLNVALDPVSLDIAASGNDVYVSYAATGPNATDVFVAHSDNNGQSFKPEVNVSNNNAGRNAADPQITTSGNRVVVTWRNDPDPVTAPDPGIEIYFTQGQ